MPRFKRAPKRPATTKKSGRPFKKRKSTKPRKVIKTSPSSSPNTHNFKRSYDHPFTIGVADNNNGLFMNTDDKYMIIKLHAKFNKLPNYDEFQSLFSEYKITSLNHRLVPYYSQNQPFSNGIAPDFAIAIPNYELFNMPVASSVRENDFATMSGTDIDNYINESQRKARRLMPSKTMNFKSLNPKVVSYKGPVSKDAGAAMMVMEAPSYLNTNPTPIVAGAPDQTNVIHYSTIMLLRRVDGLAMNVTQPHNNFYQRMGFRLETEVFFKTRKVQ